MVFLDELRKTTQLAEQFSRNARSETALFSVIKETRDLDLGIT
jgi:hypothetical protein